MFKQIGRNLDKTLSNAQGLPSNVRFSHQFSKVPAKYEAYKQARNGCTEDSYVGYIYNIILTQRGFKQHHLNEMEHLFSEKEKCILIDLITSNISFKEQDKAILIQQISDRQPRDNDVDHFYNIIKTKHGLTPLQLKEMNGLLSEEDQKILVTLVLNNNDLNAQTKNILKEQILASELRIDDMPNDGAVPSKAVDVEGIVKKLAKTGFEANKNEFLQLPNSDREKVLEEIGKSEISPRKKNDLLQQLIKCTDDSVQQDAQSEILQHSDGTSEGVNNDAPTKLVGTSIEHVD